MAYRSDADALVAQCEALRRELASAEIDADELARLRVELEHKTRELKRLQAQLDPAQVQRRRQRLVAGLVALASLGGVAWVATRPVPPRGSAEWFASARVHCNPLEARDHLARSRPPEDQQSVGYLATCWALGGHIDEARRVLLAGGPRRADGLSILFDIAHPIADRGDDRAAGPIMGLILELWPQNYMAWYHAGMSDYAGGDAARARLRLEQFLVLYKQGDGWRANAETALRGMSAGRSFTEAFAGKHDPRIE